MKKNVPIDYDIYDIYSSQIYLYAYYILHIYVYICIYIYILVYVYMNSLFIYIMRTVQSNLYIVLILDMHEKKQNECAVSHTKIILHIMAS